MITLDDIDTIRDMLYRLAELEHMRPDTNGGPSCPLCLRSLDDDSLPPHTLTCSLAETMERGRELYRRLSSRPPVATRPGWTCAASYRGQLGQ